MQRELASKEEQNKAEKKQIEQKNIAVMRTLKEEIEGFARERDQLNR